MPTDLSIMKEAASAVTDWAGDFKPTTAVVLGSGWSDVLAGAKPMRQLPYTSIPGLGGTTIQGHSGSLSLVTHSGCNTLVFEGRRHLYEGAGWTPVLLPVFLCLSLKIRNILLTNAAGGIRPDMTPGDLVIIDDHLNLMGSNPLIGPHMPEFGPRFPGMEAVYNPILRNLMDKAAQEAKTPVKHGIYAAMSGPSYETPAEIRALAAMGADMVGMSTVPEAIAAHASGMNVVAMSCIANAAAGGATGHKTTHEEVLKSLETARAKIRRLLEVFLKKLPAN